MTGDMTLKPYRELRYSSVQCIVLVLTVDSVMGFHGNFSSVSSMFRATTTHIIVLIISV